MRTVMALGLSLALAACGGGDATTETATGSGDAAGTPAEKAVFRFSAIPDHGQSELKQKFDKVAAHLSEELGVPVEYTPAADYKASVEMFKNGQVQMAWFGGLTGGQARLAVKGAKAVVQGKADPQYYSYFIAHASTGLERSDAFPQDIAKFPFAFGSESSTSGRLMPEFFIRKNTGKAPRDLFAQPVAFSGSHPKTAEMVQDGTTVKVGALNYKTYDAMVKEGKLDPAKCKVIWKTPYYADYNVTVHPDLETTFGAGFTEKLTKAMLDMKDPELVGAFKREAFIPAKNADFQAIEDVARELGLVRDAP
jgi:phosphonate transport system substrate-binding protein